MGEFLVLHGFLEAGCFLPEEALPSREVCALEKGVLQNALHSTESLDHISAIIVKVPELAVVLLMCPPEWVLLENLILLEVLSHSPPFVISESQSIFLE